MKIIDTHVHFWDPERLTYPWIEGRSAFDRSYSPEDYRRAAADVQIERLVFVECDAHVRCAIAEAEWVTGLAQSDPRIQAIVARGPLLDPDWIATLEVIAALPLVRGIRDNIQGHPAGFPVQDGFVRGVREIHRRGLHFELCLKHQQLEEAIQLVRLCPDGQFVLDHCAKPDIKGRVREPWNALLKQMAHLPNVTCKISGLVTEADWEDRRADQLLWYARAAVDAFGPDRIMFGSDWPVNEVAGGFGRWFDLVSALTAPWSQSEREHFFWRNAERVYRLDASG